MSQDIRYNRLVDFETSFEAVQAAIAFEHRVVRVWGADHFQPRLTKWYGPLPYRYSGLTWDACELPPLIEQLRRRVEAQTGGRFNSVLCNLYRDGRDTVSWHSDDETHLGPDPEIASLSFGVGRRFQLRHKETGERREFTLMDGDLLYMGRGVQRVWQHRVPREGRVVGVRLNLTFRQAF